MSSAAVLSGPWGIRDGASLEGNGGPHPGPVVLVQHEPAIGQEKGTMPPALWKGVLRDLDSVLI